MKILKIGIVLLAAFGFGFGASQIIKGNEVVEAEEYDYNQYFEYCMGNNYRFQYMLETLSEEDRVLVSNKLDELYEKYETNEFDFINDYEIRHLIMTELFDYIEDNNITIYNDEWNGYHHHMPRW
jgi:hypothetical protein